MLLNSVSCFVIIKSNFNVVAALFVIRYNFIFLVWGSTRTVLSCGAVCFVIQCGSNSLVCVSNQAL